MIRLTHPVSVFGRIIDSVEVRTLSIAEAKQFPSNDFELYDLAASVGLPINIAAELDLEDVEAITVERSRLEAEEQAAGIEFAPFAEELE